MNQTVDLKAKKTLINLLADLERMDLITLSGMMTANSKEPLQQIHPLYFNNICSNECLYCGHRVRNLEEPRRVHSINFNLELIDKLSQSGVKRVQLVINYNANELHIVSEVVRFATIKGLIPSICTEGLNLVELKQLKNMGVVEYYISQETFNRDKYAEVHLSGRKVNYRLQFEAPDLACQIGFKVGIGLLIGLYDWREDIFSLVTRVKDLMEKYPASDISFFFNLLRATPGGKIPVPMNQIDPLLLKKIVMSVRITCPFIKITTTTRELDYAQLESLIDYEIVSYQGNRGVSS